MRLTEAIEGLTATRSIGTSALTLVSLELTINFSQRWYLIFENFLEIIPRKVSNWKHIQNDLGK